jgi:CubicO group peptidase (beta-lactamase class C family)
MLVRTLLLGCLFLPLTHGEAQQRDFESLLNRLDQIRKTADVAGLGITLVDGDGTLFTAGRGLADRASNRPMTADTLIRIGSITKTISGLSFLALERDGQLSLETEIRTLTNHPPYDNKWANSHPVTLAQLLEHSAGLGDLSKLEWDHNTPLTLDEAFKVDPKSRRLQWPPGLHSSYSNSGAGIAAWAMQQATQLDFEAYTARSVFAPLGMSTASFTQDETAKSVLATGYNTDGHTVIPYWHTLYRPFAGINISIRQMGPLVRMLLSQGELGKERVFPASAIRRMENPATTLAARSGLEFGYGLGNYQWVHKGSVFHGHGGDADGYLSHFGYNREAGLGYFVVINAFQGTTLRRLRKEIEDFIVNGLSPEFQPGVPQPTAELKQLTGRFQASTRRFSRQTPGQLEVVFDQGRLYLVRGAGRQHLIPLRQRHFRRPFEPVATIAFIEDDEQQLHLQGPFGNYVRLNDKESQTKQPDLQH